MLCAREVIKRLDRFDLIPIVLHIIQVVCKTFRIAGDIHDLLHTVSDNLFQEMCIRDRPSGLSVKLPSEKVVLSLDALEDTYSCCLLYTSECDADYLLGRIDHRLTDSPWQ